MKTTLLFFVKRVANGKTFYNLARTSTKEKSDFMNKLFILSTLALFLTQASVYGQRSCGTAQHMLHKAQQDPKLYKQMLEYEQVLEHWIAQHQNQKTPSVITIPVVVHVVYNTAAENISDAQVLSQIDILNEDFRRLNADASSTPSPFAAVAADCEIEFCMAQQDPQGNATNGIVRTQTNVSVFGTNDQVKFDASGGDDAWDVTKYFNFWVCDLGAGLLGYGEFPTGSLSNTWGQVCNYTAFGNTGAAQPPFNLGRTTTHEVGHCFNLRHIWGDATCGNDQISDTPTAEGPNFSCPSYPHVTSCGNGPNGEMFMNYMDYVDDNCMNTFTQGQKTRMLAVLNTAPWNVLLNSIGCVPVNAAPNDAGITAVSSPSGSICSTSLTPSVTLKNFGASPLTSVTIKYSIDAGTPASYAWTGNLTSAGTTTVTLPTITTSSGAHTFEAYTENPNGSTDGDANNDDASSSFTVNAGGGVALPLVEGFEGATFPPSNWALNNSDNNTTWARSTQAAKTGSASAFMDNFDYAANGEHDELLSPIFSTGTSAMLTFDLAYSLYTDPNFTPNFSDTLVVYFSANCGSTWTQVYRKSSTALTTKTPSFQATEFIPTSSQWRNESVNLSPFLGGGSGMLKFVSITDYENNLFLDNVNISGTVSTLSRSSSHDLSIYPNPTHNMVYVSGSEVASISVYNLLGKELLLNTHLNDATHEISLINHEAGVYFIKVLMKDQSVETFKILKQ